MTGIERLRELAGGTTEVSVWMCTDERYGERHGLSHGDEGGPIGGLLSDIADQIERERAEELTSERGAAERRQGRCVALENAVRAAVCAMERHVSGVEGMEDSPVARWARELREALVGRDGEVVARSTVPVDDLWEARRERDLYRECLDAVRSAVVGEEVTVRGVETDGELLAIVRRVAERAARARDACEGWPRLEGGGPLRLGDEVIVGGVGVVEVSSVEVDVDGFSLRGRLDAEVMGGRLHFPAGTLVRGVGEDSWGRVLRDAAAGAMTEGELERRARELAARGRR